MTGQLEKIAYALDVLADEWDRRPASPATEQDDPITAALRAELGDIMTPELSQKIAEDPEILRVIEPLLKSRIKESEDLAIRPLGTSVEKLSARDVDVRRTASDDLAAANAYFAAKLMGHD